MTVKQFVIRFEYHRSKGYGMVWEWIGMILVPRSNTDKATVISYRRWWRWLLSSLSYDLSITDQRVIACYGNGLQWNYIRPRRNTQAVSRPQLAQILDSEVADVSAVRGLAFLDYDTQSAVSLVMSWESYNDGLVISNFRLCRHLICALKFPLAPRNICNCRWFLIFGLSGNSPVCNAL